MNKRKETIKKKIMAAFLAVVFILTLFPFTVNAADSKSGRFLEWEN